MRGWQLALATTCLMACGQRSTLVDPGTLAIEPAPVLQGRGGTIRVQELQRSFAGHGVKFTVTPREATRLRAADVKVRQGDRVNTSTTLMALPETTFGQAKITETVALKAGETRTVVALFDDDPLPLDVRTAAAPSTLDVGRAYGGPAVLADLDGSTRLEPERGAALLVGAAWRRMSATHGRVETARLTIEGSGTLWGSVLLEGGVGFGLGFASAAGGPEQLRAREAFLFNFLGYGHRIGRVRVAGGLRWSVGEQCIGDPCVSDYLVDMAGQLRVGLVPTSLYPAVVSQTPDTELVFSMGYGAEVLGSGWVGTVGLKFRPFASL